MADLENYRIIKNLGSGAFGQVKRNFYKVASHIITKTLVAIKVVKKQLAQERGLLKNIKNEARFLHRFSHQHIIKLFEYIKTESVHYLILEYASGGELYSLLEKRGRIPENEAKRLFYQTVTAVQYSHSQGVAHRDIKPENILLDELNNIKLGDFGLSNIMRDGAFMKTACGSANYAAPEILSGHIYSGSEADIWSLGVLLFAILSGALPFDDVSMPALVLKIKDANYKIPHHISNGASSLISGILVPNPLLRLSIAEIFRHPWISESFDLPPNCLQTCDIIDVDVYRKVSDYPEFAYSKDTLERRNRVMNNESYDIFSVCYQMIFFQKIKDQGGRHCSVIKKFAPAILSKVPASSPKDWLFCFRFLDKPENVMVTLCEALKAVGSLWKFVNPFHLMIVLKKKGEVKPRLKISAKLYEYNKMMFTDFWLVKGHYLEFLDWERNVYKAVYKVK